MELSNKPKKKSRLTLYIIIGLIVGIATGFVLNKTYVNEENAKLEALDFRLKEVKDSIRVRVNFRESVRKEALKRDSIQKASIKKDSTSKESPGKTTVVQFPKVSVKDSITIATDSLTIASLEVTKSSLNAERNEVLKERNEKTDPFSVLADVFLRLIKMIVAPLVFTTLVVGVAKLGDISAVGRIGGKTLLWFIGASLMSLLLGMILVNLFKPGTAMHLPLPDTGDVTGIAKGEFKLRDFLYHVFPSSVIDAMAKNEILQIVVFSLFFGVATAAIGEQGKVVINFMDAAAHVILKVTGYVMNAAPIAVFGAMAAIIAKQGLGILKTYSIFIGEFYFGLALLWTLLALAGFLVVGKRIVSLFKRIKEPVLLAFSTSSSEAAFPKTMEELQRFGAKDKIVSFVLPLGYSFNLDGSMMYMTFASLFIAQSYGMDLPIATQISMLLVLMLTSKGIAGVPRASLVVIAGTLATFDIPEAGLALLLGIDPLLDMGRSATNVVGNSIATAAVSKWENSLEPEKIES